MRRPWLFIIALISFCTVAYGSFLHKLLSILLSGLLSFNSFTGNGYLFDNGSANAVIPKNSAITNVNTEVHRNKEICVPLLGCVKTPLPGGIENTVNDAAKKEAYNALRNMIASEVPIVGTTEHKLYKHVDKLPGKVFTPKTLNLASFKDSDVLPFGDYEIPAHFYCTKVYTLNGSGNRYVLAKLNGKMSNALSSLYQRASKTLKPTSDVQVLSWSIQTGVPYSKLSNSSKALVDELIPEYRGKMDVGFYEKLIGTWNDVSRLTKLPSFNETLDKLGSAGDITKSLLRAREEILQSSFSYSPLANSFVIPKDANLPGGSTETPWSQVHEQVYIRFIALRGALNDGVIQVRVLEAQSQNKSLNQEQKIAQIAVPFPPIPLPPPVLIGGIMVAVLVGLIVTSVGIPESAGHQAITTTPIGGTKDDTDAKPVPIPIPTDITQDKTNCRTTNVPRLGGNRIHDAYATKVTGSQFDFNVTTPYGNSVNFDGRVANTHYVWEVKTGYGWLFNPSKKTIAQKKLQEFDVQRNQQLQVANSCGFNLRWAFQDSAVANLLRTRWGNIPEVFYIP